MTDSYRVDEVLHKHTNVVCGADCGWRGRYDGGKPIEGASLTPGDPSPACRCPECDALAYPVEPRFVIAKVDQHVAFVAKNGECIDHITEQDNMPASAFVATSKALLEAAGCNPVIATEEVCAYLDAESDEQLDIDQLAASEHARHLAALAALAAKSRDTRG